MGRFEIALRHADVTAAFWFLSSLQFQILSWRSDSVVRRTVWEILAVASFGLALASHEAAITLPVIAWFMWRTHMIQHAFDYFVGLYVGPGSWPAYAICVLGIGLLLVVNPMTRFGCLWLLVTLMPYLGFVGGNVSRYSYVPSMGFALAIGSALLEAIDWLDRPHGSRRSPALKWVAFSLATLFIVIRFGRFSSKAIRQDVAWTEEWRQYARVCAGKRADRPMESFMFPRRRAMSLS